MNNTEEPTVSVIIPLYNREKLVGKTLDSIAQQTYPHWEAVVVDDGSTDSSCELVSALAQQDERVKLLRRQREPKGAPTCRNIGAEKAQGQYLIFLDSDDLLASFCLEQRMKVIEVNPNLDFWVFSMLVFHQEAGDTNILWNIATQEDDLSRFLRIDAVWQTSCLVHRKSAFCRYGRFDESLPYWQDYELHVRLLAQSLRYKKYMHLPPDCYYRSHDGTTLSQNNQAQTMSRIRVMTSTYQKLTKILLQHQAITDERKKQIQSTYFWLSVNHLINTRSITNSLDNWCFGYEARLEHSYRFVVGYFCLSFKFLSVYLPYGTCLFAILYKLMVRLLPKRYRQPNTLLFKTTYQQYKNTNQKL